MEVNDPGSNVFEPPASAQLQARELGKLEALIPYLLPKLRD